MVLLQKVIALAFSGSQGPARVQLQHPTVPLYWSCFRFTRCRYLNSLKRGAHERPFRYGQDPPNIDNPDIRVDRSKRVQWLQVTGVKLHVHFLKRNYQNRPVNEPRSICRYQFLALALTLG